MELYYGVTLQNYITGSCSRIILRDHITQLYYGIIFHEKDSGYARDAREPPWIQGIPWERPLDPWGRPQEPPGAPWTLPQTIKTARPRRSSSARIFRLLHPKHFVATHRPKDSPGPLYMYTMREEPLLVPLALGLRSGFTQVLWLMVPWIYIDQPEPIR